MEQKMKVAIACGGTGGHIFPGLATGHELLDRGHDVTLWLAGKDIESDAVKEWTGHVITIPSEGFQFGFSIRSLWTVFRLAKAYRLALHQMRKDRPEILLAMGSYASFGPVSAAKRLGIPYVLHEANLLPGRAVSLLARNAHTVAVSFDKTRYYLKHREIVTTGMPLRRELQGVEARAPRTRVPTDPLRILVMGGSRGARVLNEVVPQAIAAAAGTGITVEVEHIAGLQNSEDVEKGYEKAGIKANVHHFVQHMEEIYTKVDFAICRAGAATCAELACYSLPALLIPYPTAVRDHQMGNARVLQDISAADVIAESDLTSSWLRDYLISISEKPERLDNMASAMEKRAQPNAAGKLSDLLEKVCGSQQ